MKILLIGDASNYHNALGKGFSRLGHDVTLASDGSRWMDTERHIDLTRMNNKAGGALLWLRLSTILASRLRGYDVVQLVSPIFVQLRPKRVAELFKRLKHDNGSVYLTALGTDTSVLKMALDPGCPLRYTEWRVDGNPTPYALSPRGQESLLWLKDPLLSHSEMIYENVDGVITALYEYQLAMERVLPKDKIAYGGIPVDIESIPFVPAQIDAHRTLKVLAPYHGGRELEKGTDIMRQIAQSVPTIDLQPVTGLKFSEFQQRIADSDVVLDQYYSYTPATTALMAMAMGKVVATGAEKDFENFIGESVPAINVGPHDHETLRRFLATGDAGKPVGGKEARDFVERNNDAVVVAQRFVDFYTMK